MLKLHDPFNGPEHDLPLFIGKPLIYAICAVPRSGSTLLARAFAATGRLGAPAEYFNGRVIADFHKRWGQIDMTRYVALLMQHRTSLNGVFGMSVLFPHIEQHYRHMPPASKVIYIYRRDKIRQAVSWARAAQNDIWTSEMPLAHNERYNRRLIADFVRAIFENEAKWQQTFSQRSIKPLEIAYEALSTNYVPTVQSIARFIGITLAEVPDPPITKQADDTTEEWALRFARESAASERSA